MAFDLFINFAGECKEAVDFYARVFKSEVKDLMTYDQAPQDSGYPIPEADKKKVMYSCVPIFGCNAMFCDVPSDTPLVIGNNICPTIGIEDKDEITRLFNELKEGGTVEMELQKTFWSDLFGMVKDKYGVIWQLSHAVESY